MIEGAWAKAASLAARDTHAQPRLRAAVHQSWFAVLGIVPRSDETAFFEDGGDSLKALQLAFHLERALDQEIPLDLISPESTPAQLVDDIGSHLQGTAPASPPRSPVFLCPGLGGDEPRLAALRRELSPIARFQTLNYPGLEAPIQRIGDLSAIGAHVAGAIQTAQPSGPISLLGYSFGGLVALAAVGELRRLGRQVAFFGVLDANVTPAGRRQARLLDADWESDQRLRPKTSSGEAGWRERLLETAVAILFRRRAYRTLKAIVRLRSRYDRRGDGVYLTLLLLQRLRLRAMRRARLEPVNTPVHLFRAEGRREIAEPPSDLGWGAYAPTVTVVTMQGGHWSQFEREDLPRNAQRIAVALLAALTHHAASEPTT